MDQFENNLRNALREPQPPGDLAGKVMTRIALSRRRLRSALLAAAAAVLVLIAISLAVVQKPVVSSENGDMLTLADGSRVEVRPHSKVTLHTAQDGALLQLNGGSIIVTAAKQRSGHLYVRTRDVLVSVVGTVFLVDAEEEGSRVAVIQGEVQVQQGASLKKLGPGEQVVTNPAMRALPVEEEISWSRSAASHAELLRQSLAPLQPSVLSVPSAAPQNAPEPRAAFEVASVRFGDAAPDRGGRGGGMPFGFGCGGSFLQVDPARFAISTNLFTLVALAFGKPCVSSAKLDLLTGGPAWVKSDVFTIQATIPEGTPAYTSRQLLSGRAPKLQAMIEKLLRDRFKLSVHSDTGELAVYALTVVKGGPKLTPFQEGSCDATSPLTLEALRPRQGQKPLCSQIFNLNQRGHFNVIANGSTLDEFAQILTGALDRPVINRTGIAGVFDLHLESAPDWTIFCHEPPCSDLPVDNPPSVFDAIQRQLGLKLESTKAPVEVLVIDRAEKPSEN
jgi:uncharacterized protein (TIGR03435 family)